MQRIPSVPLVNPSKEHKLVDRVARRDPKTYRRSYGLVELEEWIRGTEKIFTIIKALKENKVNIRTFYLAEEADI